MLEYPKMLYRDGTTLEWEGLSLDALIVEDEAAELAALDDGWRANAAELAEPKPVRRKTA